MVVRWSSMLGIVSWRRATRRSCAVAHISATRRLPDQRWAGTGPLGGLSAALRFAVERDFDRVVTVPCDMPDIPRDLLETLASASDALILDGAPVVGGWPANLSDQLEHFLCSDRRKAVRDWARLAGAGVLTGWAVRNINFPADLPALDD